MAQNNISEFNLYILNYNLLVLYIIYNSHDAFDLFINILDNSKKIHS